MKLDVLGKKIPLKYEDNPRCDDGKEVHGYYDSELELVAIDSKLTHDKHLQSVIHEYFHAVTFRALTASAPSPKFFLSTPQASSLIPQLF